MKKTFLATSALIFCASSALAIDLKLICVPYYFQPAGTTQLEPADRTKELAVAVILDRIVHNAYQLALDGPSMRKLKANQHPEPGGRPSAIEAHRHPNASTKPQKADPK